MNAAIVIIIVLIVLAIVAVLLVTSYNGFVRDRNRIQESWRQVDVELNRRYELLPNLIETVRAYAAHERNTLEDITRLRGQARSLAQGGNPTPERAAVEDQLTGAVHGLMVSVEAYPNLQSNQNFLELQRALAETEDRIANGRRFYNANVRQYNTRVESVPSNLIAGLFHFEKATYFEVTDPQARTAPSVNFGEIAYRGDPQVQPQQGQQQLPQQQSNPVPGFGTPNPAQTPAPQQPTAPNYQQQPAQQPYPQPGQQYPPQQPYPQTEQQYPPQQGQQPPHQGQ
ncbi:LemA family protein [Microlunatus elymi]|uniref:LemA family protein n=1 Tax=Microlunatus elymi TaxID=2596828 RepID=A0A516Q4Z9_9ACTN|nr:LemA family protein [Microlunatus elymi]QDP98442.1 LemA family protein [Microlunatus elymi]